MELATGGCECVGALKPARTQSGTTRLFELSLNAGAPAAWCAGTTPSFSTASR